MPLAGSSGRSCGVDVQRRPRSGPNTCGLPTSKSPIAHVDLDNKRCRVVLHLAGCLARRVAALVRLKGCDPRRRARAQASRRTVAPLREGRRTEEGDALTRSPSLGLLVRTASGARVPRGPRRLLLVEPGSAADQSGLRSPIGGPRERRHEYSSFSSLRPFALLGAALAVRVERVPSGRGRPEVEAGSAPTSHARTGSGLANGHPSGAIRSHSPGRSRGAFASSS